MRDYAGARARGAVIDDMLLGLRKLRNVRERRAERTNGRTHSVSGGSSGPVGMWEDERHG